MVLAASGIKVPESELEAQARMHPTGTPLDEVERLARQYRLVAEIQETTVEDLRRILAEGRLPIALIDRAVFDLKPRQRASHLLRDAKMHMVIPTRVTDAYILFHDPLPPSVSRRQAHESLATR
jgi:hypothetical protein